MAEVAAGWYPDPHDSDRLRYWDGVQWTHARTPVGIPPPPALPDVPSIAPTGAPIRRGRPRLSPNVVAGIGVGLAVLGLVVGLVVVSGMVRPSVAGPTAAPEATAAPAPAPAAGDAATFRDDAAKQLDDMAKDLDDIVTTVAQNGVFRLYSNSVELEFNLAQLRGIAVPASVATTWPAALDAIGTSLAALDDAIGTGDGDTILAAVDGVRAQVDAARAVARSAR